jgi:hypothetical protein
LKKPTGETGENAGRILCCIEIDQARLIQQFLEHHQVKMIMIQKRKKRTLSPQMKGNQDTSILRIHLERNVI